MSEVEFNRENFIRSRLIKLTIGRECAEECCRKIARSGLSSKFRYVLGHTPQSIKYRLGMELRSQTKVSGSQIRPRATSEGRTELGANRLDDTITTTVNSPSSPTGIARGGKFSHPPRKGWSVQGLEPQTP